MILFLYLLLFIFVARGNEDLYLKLNEKALDSKLCKRQLEYIINDPWLLLDFINSGPRIPRNMLSENPLDLGNYQKCLDIDVISEKDDIDIKGRYCSITLYYNYNQSLDTTKISKQTDLFPEKFNLSEVSTKRLKKLKLMQLELVSIIDISRKIEKEIVPGDSEVTLAVCVPKQCSTEQALSSLFVNLTALGLPYTENYCRFKNDKPWVTVDYVALTILAIAIFLAIASTGYDLWHTLKLKSDPGSVNPVFRSFSVFTNGRRLLAITSSPDTLECVDGIRALSMFWIILLHTYTRGSMLLESDKVSNWVKSLRSMWITAGTIAVDTFFMMSGMLLVYTAAKKMSSMQLLKNLHHFYLNRYLRMFPVLATAILLQSSLLQHVADGPLWSKAYSQVNNCRRNWWLTLLYVQNYVHTAHKCLPHTWYLAVDIQLHIVSPLILFWVLSGKKRVAWVALTTALLACLTGATVKNFIDQVAPPSFYRKEKKFSRFIQSTQIDGSSSYFIKYYMNTLTRAPPFLVGMVIGYLLHLYRKKKLYWSKVIVSLVWVGALFLNTSVLVLNHPSEGLSLIKFSFINSFSRCAWAVGLGWMIFACVKGYGGPVNWFLSLKMWKLSSRLSYAMYILHFQYLLVISASEKETSFFSVMNFVKIFLNTTIIIFALSFIMTLLVEVPFSILIDKLFNSGKKTYNVGIDAKLKSNSRSMTSKTATANNVGQQKDPIFEISAL